MELASVRVKKKNYRHPILIELTLELDSNSTAVVINRIFVLRSARCSKKKRIASSLDGNVQHIVD